MISRRVRDILSFLTVIDNPEDDGALMRVINVPARGIGEKSIEKLLELARHKNTSISRILQQSSEVQGLSAKATAACREFAGMLDGWRAGAC